MGELISMQNGADLAKVVLKAGDAGTDCFAFEYSDSAYPEWDYFFESEAAAKDFCRERWGVPIDSWTLVTAS